MPDYTFFPAEGGILAEVYLPKRAHFQGVLYKSLTDGFDVAKVQAHFNNRANHPKIKRILRHFYPILANYTAAEIRAFPDVLHGYSMYEVDGVFASKTYDGRGKKRKLKIRIDEERTQVIRIVFKPDLDFIKAHVLRLSAAESASPAFNSMSDETYREYRDVIGRTLSGRSGYDRNLHKVVGQGKNRAKKIALAKHIRLWLEYCGLFLFGFVIFNICDHLLPEGTKIEDEIWVTSLWDISINRMVLDGPSSRRKTR